MDAPGPMGRKITNVEREAATRQAILRKRTGYTATDMEMKPKNPNDGPYDEFYTVVKANDYTKNISEPLFSAGLVGEGYTERINQVLENSNRIYRNSKINMAATIPVKSTKATQSKSVNATPQKKGSKMKELLNE